MREEIIDNLRLIEDEEHIHILYACESGSRAWGFPSAESDYDVRFIYVRKKEWYLRIDQENCRDVIERPINNLLDINGWDIKKALQLLAKSNPALIEWLDSPVTYVVNEAFINQFSKLIQANYSPRACFHHYANLARSNFREYLKGKTVRVKKYLYVLRPILAMRWIERNRNALVPTEFTKLVHGTVDNPDLLAAIFTLQKQKIAGFSAEYMPRIEIISSFIEEELSRNSNTAAALESNCPDYHIFNNFFINCLADSTSKLR